MNDMDAAVGFVLFWVVIFFLIMTVIDDNDERGGTK